MLNHTMQVAEALAAEPQPPILKLLQADSNDVVYIVQDGVTVPHMLMSPAHAVFTLAA